MDLEPDPGAHLSPQLSLHTPPCRAPSYSQGTHQVRISMPLDWSLFFFFLNGHKEKPMKPNN